jgi:ABC-type transport system substrate-binding protein
VNEAADVAEVLQNVYEGLVTLDENTRPIPCLAEKWDLSTDGKTYTFQLNPKARFHPPFERPITAADIKYSIERAFWPETRATVLPLVLEDIVGAKEAAQGKRRDIPGVKVVDDRTVEIMLERPRGYMMMELATPMVVCREAIEKNGGKLDRNAAVGTGPFRFGDYRANSSVTLEANPGYYRGAPKLTRIERPIVIDPQTVRSKYETNEIDLCTPSFQDFVADQSNPSFQAESKIVNAAGVNYLVMHPKDIAPFRDPRVRRALDCNGDR